MAKKYNSQPMVLNTALPSLNFHSAFSELSKNDVAGTGTISENRQKTSHLPQSKEENHL